MPGFMFAKAVIGLTGALSLGIDGKIMIGT